MESKRAKVIMLPTDDNSYIAIIGDSKTPTYVDDMYKRTSFCITQHLYITTDDEIKEGDWCVSMKDTTGIMTDEFMQQLAPFKAIKSTLKLSSEYKKKIIATTDKSLCDKALGITDEGRERIFVDNYLPQPSQAFIEKYCKLGGIDEVLVELEEIKTGDTGNGYYFKHQIKVDSHNTITIHPIKDSWSRAEYNQIARDAFRAGMAYESLCRRGFKSEATDENTWIKENL